MDTKVCNKCNVDKPVSEYYIDPRRNKPRGICKKCMNDAKLAANRNREGGNQKYQLKYYLKNKYGIELDTYIDMMESTSHCELCGAAIKSRITGKSKGKFKALDHCHKTGKIRGVICSNCNIALGLINDDVETLKRMIIYLDTHKV